MKEIQYHDLVFPALLSLFLLWPVMKWFSKADGSKNSRPPKLPLIGNLHQLGSVMHRNLQSLAMKHGSLMLLHFGRVPVLVVSSADAASEVLGPHDITFADRLQNKASKKLVYNARNITFSPYGDYWRQLKSIFVLQLLSTKRVKSFRPMREEETVILVKMIGESEGPVNLSEMFGEFSNGLICRLVFGAKERECGEGNKLLQLLVELMEVLGIMSIGDFIPWLSWMDRVNGFDGRLDKVSKETNDFLEDVIQRRLEAGAVGRKGDNFLDILLHIQNKEGAGQSIDRDSIKSIILDAIAGGTDTIFTTLEWAMTELLQNPTVMAKLQDEVREVVNHKQDISDMDLEKMHYLKAVIKETLRYHPAVALTVPRVAREGVKVKGYEVSMGTITIVNIWAIGRDSAFWDEPEKFKPERFSNSSMDINSSSLRWIPFRAGRRGCPGKSYGMAAVELVLANLVQKFDWKLPNGVVLDMAESGGLTAHRATPLVAVASTLHDF